MRPRRPAAAVAGAVLVALALVAPPAAAAPPARATDDACPAGSVPEDVFADLPPAATHESAVDCIVWWEIANGYSRSTYEPQFGIARDQMATFLAHLIRSSGRAAPRASRDHFVDDGGSVHEDNINALAEAGVVSGRQDGRYQPNLVVTRGQMATFLVTAYDERARQAGQPKLAGGPNAFADDDGTTHETSIDRAAAAGLAAGMADGRYAERLEVRRDQMASFVARTLDLLVENGAATTPLAQPGQLDPSFGEQGITKVEVGDAYDEARAAALDADGRLVLGGESSVTVDTGGFVQQVRVFTLTRLLRDGSPDPGFGGEGTVTGEAGDAFRVLSVAVQPDGKVLAGGFAICGRMCTASVLARFRPDGTPDAGFGDGGRVTLQFEETGPISALLVDGEGRIVAGGQNRPIGSADFNDFSVVRYLPDGTLDATFGGDGRVVTDFRAGSDIVASLAAAPDGAIVAGGTSHAPHQNAPVEPRFALARYLPDGSLDPSFAGDGTVETDVSSEPGTFETLASVALAPDGGIVAAGHARPDGLTPRIAVTRYTAAGAPDAAFGTAGVAELDLAPASEASAVVVQGDGRMVVAGRAADNPAGPTAADPPGQLGSDTDWTWALLRLGGDGRLDGSFGHDGVVRTPVGKAAKAVVLQPDGRLVVAGCDCPQPLSGPGGVESTSAMVVTRYLGGAAAPAPAGQVDRSFGDAGLASVHVGERYSAARAAAVDGEGRIVLAGLSSRSIGLTRLLPDGGVDPAFGDGGIVVTSVGTASVANAVLVQPDGRIVAAGRTSSTDASSFALVRYTADGRLDPSFGDGGVVVTPSTGYPEVKALAQLPDGRLLAVGSAVVADDFTDTGFLVARYLPDGSPDPAFGGDGLVMVDFRRALDSAEDVVVLPDGRIVVGGTSNEPDPVTAVSSDVALARLLDDGSLDPTFGADGTVRADLGPGYDALGGLALQRDGALIAATDVDPYAAGPLAVARFTESGALDPSFGSGGVTTTDLGHPSRASGVAVQPGGRILVAGVTGPEEDPLWALVGYTPDGALDASFDGDGVARTAAGRAAHALTLEPDGDVVVAGCDCPEPQFDRSGRESVSAFVAVRYAGGS